MVSDLLTIAISMMSDYSYLIEDSLKNYIEFYKMFMTNMEYKIMSEKYGFKPILDLLFRVEKFEKGEYDLSTNTIPNNYFDYYWPFSNTFLISSIEDDHHKWLNSENGWSSSTEYSIQGDTNIDTRTDNTHGYNDVDYKGFNTVGTGNDGIRYTNML